MKRFLIVAMTVLALGLGTTRAGPAEGPEATQEQGDPANELKVLRPMAAQGHATAQFNLGVMHDFGRGVAQDYGEAVKWYRLAAAQGHPAAQFNLAGMYLDGLGVAQDHVRAYMWFALGAGAGYPGAAKNRNSIARQMTPGQIAQAQQLALDCQQRQFKDCD